MGAEADARTLLEATDSGGYADELRTLARILAGAIDECESKRDLAALSRRYLEVAERIEGRGKEPGQGIADLVMEGQLRHRTLWRNWRSDMEDGAA